MKVTTYQVGGQTFELHGANADLWQVATGPKRIGFFAKHLETLASALGATPDAERVDASKSLIRRIWGQWPMLGPYPFIDTLSKFEFGRTFHDAYRDHVCHQLKVYLLGLGIFDNCPSVADGLDKAGLANDFERLWAVTSVFHDVGYVIEADDSQPGKVTWQKMVEEYANVMQTPFSATGLLGLGSAEEHAIGRQLHIPRAELGAVGDIEENGAFREFEEEAKRAQLTGRNVKESAIQAYYNYAQKTNASNRSRFRDHGVASALLLIHHWANYNRYIRGWLDKADSLRSYEHLELSRLQQLEVDRSAFYKSLCRAAGAMSVHNITPSQWTEEQHRDAHSQGVNFERFRISFDDPTASGKATPLAFLLGFVDTLQDWDRPTFDDHPRASALKAQDLRVLPQNDKVYVFVRADHEEFRDPARSRRSRFNHMRTVMESYLDPAMVGRLLEWGGTLEPNGDEASAAVAAYVNSSHLGHRLRVSEAEKRAIAKHCASTNFWLSTDTVFLEAGTLPIHMIFELYRQRLMFQPRPKRIITNNLACALLAVMNEGPGQTKYPQDEPSSLFVVGGRVVNDYAGTIPGGTNHTSREDSELWDENLCGSHDGIRRCLDSAGVNHVVMMTTRLDPDHGPCAASEWMRRYKKRLLQYVAEHDHARLSILGEADKLYTRDGNPADAEDGPERYWPTLLSKGRVNIVCARSATIGQAELDLVKLKLRKLARAKANVTLLGPSGEPEPYSMPTAMDT